MLVAVIAYAASLGLVSQVRADEVQCYAPDGQTLADNVTYVPCNKLGITQDGVYSSCCRLDGDPDERDLCASSGLCLNGGVLFRGYCTDQNWDSPACVNVCVDETNGGSSNDTVEITPCTDGKYCCGHNNLSCCGTDQAFEIPTQASVVSDNATETQVVTETAFASADDSVYKNATIGLAVVLGVLMLVAAGVIFWLLKKNKALYQKLQTAEPAMQQASDSAHADPYLQVNDAATDLTGPRSPRQHWSSVKSPGSPSIPEVDGTSQRYSELDASMAGTVRYNGPSSPGLDYSHNSTPVQSPRL